MKRSRTLTAFAVAAVMGGSVLHATTAFAALDKCEKVIDNESAKLQKFLFTALQKCKDAVQKENVKGVTSTLGTNCQPGGGCLANAAKLCELQLAKIFDLPTGAASTKSKASKFRAAIVKARTANGSGVRVCEDADITPNPADNNSALGHLISGAAGYAPPKTGDLGKFMIDWMLFAIEKVVVKQQLFVVPNTLNLIQAAVEAPAGPTNPSGVAAKKGTSCSTLNTDPNTQEYRPNLCRFGVECKDYSCQLDTSGTCPATGNSACDTTIPSTCNGGSSLCFPSKSFVEIASEGLQPLIGTDKLPVAALGGLNLEICRPGRSSGQCQTGGGACETDADCTGANAPPCNLFPNQGAGAAFGVEPNFLYLINEPAKTLRANVPPVNVPPLPTFIAAACIDLVRSEGWCDCAGAGVQKNFNLCIDHITSDNTHFDDCGAKIDAADDSADSTYPGTVNGPPVLTPSGASAAGDCVDLVTAQFKLITSASDFGPDGIPCTDDDYAAPTAAFTLPMTTGQASAQIMDSVAAAGKCSVGGSYACIEDANCSVANGGPGGTCTDPAPSILPLSDTQNGAATTCAHYLAGNLSGFSIVGAISALNAQAPLGDLATAFKITCK
jgi:hypothetical protein